MEDPSNPMPSRKAPCSSWGVMAKDFKVPRTSVNHSRMNLIPRSSTVFRTYSASSESGMGDLLAVRDSKGRGREPAHGYGEVNFRARLASPPLSPMAVSDQRVPGTLRHVSRDTAPQ